MASNEPGGPEQSSDRQSDIRLAPGDRGILLRKLAVLFPDERSARGILVRIQFPHSSIPAYGRSTSLVWWNEILREIDSGIIEAGYRRLLTVSSSFYPGDPDLRELAQLYDIVDREPVNPSEACHVIVRADSEDGREVALGELRGLGLDPRENWSAATGVSYRVNRRDPAEVRRLLNGARLSWVVVPPGQPDYLLHTLYMRGPDGRQFRVTDAPAAQMVASLAADVMEQYPESERGVVVDQVATDGSSVRLDPDATLHEVGLEDGDQLNVGTEARAG